MISNLLDTLFLVLVVIIAGLTLGGLAILVMIGA